MEILEGPATSELALVFSTGTYLNLLPKSSDARGFPGRNIWIAFTRDKDANSGAAIGPIHQNLASKFHIALPYFILKQGDLLWYLFSPNESTKNKMGCKTGFHRFQTRSNLEGIQRKVHNFGIKSWRSREQPLDLTHEAALFTREDVELSGEYDPDSDGGSDANDSEDYSNGHRGTDRCVGHAN